MKLKPEACFESKPKESDIVCWPTLAISWALFAFLPLVHFTSLNLPYWQQKWEWIHFVAALILFKWVIQPPALPKLTFVCRTLVALLIAVWVSHLFFNMNQNLFFPFLDRSSIVVLVLFIYNLPLFRGSEINLTNFDRLVFYPTLTSLFALFVVYFWQVNASGFDLEDFGSWTATFSNRNMLAQYLAFSTVVLISKTLLDRSHPLNLFLLILNCSALFIISSRSTLLAVVLFLTVFAFVFFRFPRWSYGGFLTISLAIVLALPLTDRIWSEFRDMDFGFFSGHSRRQVMNSIANGVEVPGAVASETSHSIQTDLATKVELAPKPSEILQKPGGSGYGERETLILSAISMIGSQPLGYGTGTFPFRFVEYSARKSVKLTEFVLPDSPHNEFLRIAAEEGIFVAILFYLLLAYLAVHFIWSFQSNKESWVNWALLGLVIVFAIESLFQFPLENGCGALVFGLLVAIALRFNSQFEKQRRMSRVVVVLMLMFHILLVGARHTEWAQHGSEKRWFGLTSEALCHVSPDFWVSCIDASKTSSDKVGPLLMGISMNPYNYMLFRRLGDVYFESDQRAKGCEITLAYQKLFAGVTSVDKKIEELCHDFSGVAKKI